ncbi:GntR family transcriptional regulator [Lactiplantibacillus garii]|uniref:GntR family transcriptional regulator n=1 Tax=Lactiplantibacillus garii TaxID=2306423 RepID=A0A426D640_9LACO|nr:GntR family transcriptional regulator [Lactiplantibacillus garii]RRK10074.1 GntR family transcriptional regulator [Lactiplantibacillus garii]
MQFDDKVPIYLQIKRVIYQEMVTGQLKAGEQLPAVRQLALNLTVNVNTVQRALSEMITEGVLTSKRGKGNFVTEDQQRIGALKTQLVRAQLSSFYQALRALNLSDEEIITSVQHYVQRRGSQDDGHVND